MILVVFLLCDMHVQARNYKGFILAMMMILSEH